MSLDQLAEKELELYSRTGNLKGSIEEKADKVVYFGITDEYREIHNQYSLLAKKDIEALKRALFIMWYSLSEPSWLTGIGLLDKKAELRVINTLENRLKKNSIDYELKWMLDYYSTWDFVFVRFKNFDHFQNRLKTKTNTELPNKINKKEMRKRGQMGIYWSSLEIFD